MDYYFISYGLTIIALIITLGAQAFVSGSYNKYRKIRNERGLTGKDAARYFLDNNGLSDVTIEEVRGHLSDHYDPRDKVVRLSSENYRGDSISAVSVACHECGHAMQDKDGYVFMRLRARLVPITNFASSAGYFAILLGIIFGAFDLIWIGILCEVVILLFQLITLPVEFNASSRALKGIERDNYLNNKELKQGKIMLSAAAMTYVASVATSLLQILRLVLLAGRRND